MKRERAFGTAPRIRRTTRFGIRLRGIRTSTLAQRVWAAAMRNVDVAWVNERTERIRCARG